MALIFIKINVKEISVLRLQYKIKNAFIRHNLSKLFLDDVVQVYIYIATSIFQRILRWWIPYVSTHSATLMSLPQQKFD